MENEKVLEDIEYEVFKDFSKKLEPTTKHDYLSKVILFKKFLQDKELVYANKEDCKKFIKNQLVRRYIVIYIVFIIT